MKNIRDFIKNPRNIFLVIIVLLIVVGGIFYLLNLEPSQEEEVRILTPEEVMIENANSYTEAVKNSDLSACDEIADKGMKEACIRITQGKIDFARNQNLPADVDSDNLE